VTTGEERNLDAGDFDDGDGEGDGEGEARKDDDDKETGVIPAASGGGTVVINCISGG
jgi:hypothetical protein